MSILNSDLMNTIRLLTLNDNGSCTALGSFVRMGVNGSFYDNLNSGGVALMGVEDDEKKHEYSIKKEYSMFFCDTFQLPFQRKGCTLIKKHQRKNHQISSAHSACQSNRLGYSNCQG